MELDINKIIEQSRKPTTLPLEMPEGAKPSILIPSGFEVKDIEFLLPAPVRKRANVTLNDTDSYQPIKTVEWKRWNDNDGADHAMPQDQFAAFLEENMGDIATVDGMPTGTEMLRMATEFEATADKRFKSKLAVRPSKARF